MRRIGERKCRRAPHMLGYPTWIEMRRELRTGTVDQLQLHLCAVAIDLADAR